MKQMPLLLTFYYKNISLFSQPMFFNVSFFLWFSFFLCFFSFRKKTKTERKKTKTERKKTKKIKGVEDDSFEEWTGQDLTTIHAAIAIGQVEWELWFAGLENSTTVLNFESGQPDGRVKYSLIPQMAEVCNQPSCRDSICDTWSNFAFPSYVLWGYENSTENEVWLTTIMTDAVAIVAASDGELFQIFNSSGILGSPASYIAGMVAYLGQLLRKKKKKENFFNVSFFFSFSKKKIELYKHRISSVQCNDNVDNLYTVYAQSDTLGGIQGRLVASIPLLANTPTAKRSASDRRRPDRSYFRCVYGYRMHGK
jgi:hypothetical protein